jgi:hypothetical protein
VPGQQQPEQRGSRRQRLVGLAILMVAISIVAVLVARISNRDVAPTEAFSEVWSDSFDRPSSPSELGVSEGRAWTADKGVWGVEAGAAIVRGSTEGDNIATIDVAVASHTARVRVAGFAQCGVVARYQDPQNFLLLVRVNAFAVWNLIEVVDGKQTMLMKVPDSDRHDLDVSLTATDHVIAASVGFDTVRIVYETALQGTRIGLFSHGEGSTCSWTDLIVERAN